MDYRIMQLNSTLTTDNHNVGRRYIEMAHMPASRNTFSKPPNSQTTNVAGYTAWTCLTTVAYTLYENRLNSRFVDFLLLLLCRGITRHSNKYSLRGSHINRLSTLKRCAIIMANRIFVLSMSVNGCAPRG